MGKKKINPFSFLVKIIELRKYSINWLHRKGGGLERHLKYYTKCWAKCWSILKHLLDNRITCTTKYQLERVGDNDIDF